MIEQLIAEATECDFKVALEIKKPKSWLKSVSSFSNGIGGTLFFGISDDRKLMLSRLVDTFFSRTSWTMLPYVENHSISVA